MSEETEDTSLSGAASRIVNIIDPKPEPAEPAATEREAPAPQESASDEADTAPDESQPSGDENAVEDTEVAPPPVEPPAFWSANEKAHWAALHPEVQKVISERERERDAAIRRGQDEAAEARKQAEQSRGEYHERLTKVVPQLEQQLRNNWDTVDWIALGREYPADYARLRPIYEHEVATVNAAKAEKARLDDVSQKEHQAKVAKWVEEQANDLVKQIPAWKDEKTGVAELNEIRGYLVKTGVPESVVNQLADAKQIIIARKAMLYDKAQARIAKPTPAPNAPKVQKPGAADSDGPPNKSLDIAQKKLRSSGSTQDAAEVIKRLFL